MEETPGTKKSDPSFFSGKRMKEKDTSDEDDYRSRSKFLLMKSLSTKQTVREQEENCENPMSVCVYVLLSLCFFKSLRESKTKHIERHIETKKPSICMFWTARQEREREREKKEGERDRKRKRKKAE